MTVASAFAGFGAKLLYLELGQPFPPKRPIGDFRIGLPRKSDNCPEHGVGGSSICCLGAADFFAPGSPTVRKLAGSGTVATGSEQALV